MAVIELHPEEIHNPPPHIPPGDDVTPASHVFSLRQWVEANPGPPSMETPDGQLGIGFLYDAGAAWRRTLIQAARHSKLTIAF